VSVRTRLAVRWPLRSRRLPWPLPALAVWAAAWVAWRAAQGAGWASAPSFVAITLAGAYAARHATTPWRRVFVGAGFPASALATGVAAGWPAWAWLAPLGVLALLYPAHAWRDAPLFPTPHGALDGVGRRIRLADGARVLDAGCGLGAGLAALRRAFPRARLAGVEWSRPLALVCRLRLRGDDAVEVVRGDMWRHDWSAYRLVYLFQRPESMVRAVAKATRELAPGSWLASLEFEAAELIAEHVVELDGGRPVWLYRAPFRRRAP
jgi:SAM-dependent methyltransferase